MPSPEFDPDKEKKSKTKIDWDLKETKLRKQLSELSTEELLEEVKDLKLCESFGDTRFLEKAIKAFKDVPGFMEQLTKVLKYGRVGVSPGQVGTARGAIFELRTFYAEHLKGSVMKNFNITKRNATSAREFDIETTEKLIECKNIDWSGLSKQKLNDYLSNIKVQSIIARDNNLKFELHSAQNLIKEVVDFCLKNDIKFFEG